MNKPLMVFGIALAWSLGFMLFSLSWYLYFLAIVLGTFALFYFFGKTAKIRVVNQTILALFLGFLVGSLFVSPLVASLFSVTLSQFVSYLEDYMLQILNAVFSLFFPALAALLLVNLKQVTNASGSAGIEQKNN